MKLFEKYYPECCQVNCVGKSADNRNIYEVVLGNPKAKKHLVVFANLHAREYMTIQLCMKQIEYYLQNYEDTIAGEKVKKILNKVAIHYFPSCNPDGTAISQFGFDAIKDKNLRKKLHKMSGNSATWKANARGVDLNRNWNFYFAKKGKKGFAGYTGSKAHSEPEVKALLGALDVIEDQGRITGIISYHSTGSIIYGKSHNKVDSSVKKTSNKMYKLAQKLTGYSLMPVGSLKGSSGSSRDYFLFKRKIPFITVEVGTKACPLKINEFSAIWKKNKDLIIKEAMLFD